MTHDDNPFEGLKESMDAAAGPLKRMTAVTAQLALSAIPADAACCCLCPIYEPHTCDGWRAEDLEREVPGGMIFGKQLPPVQVPVCRSCHRVEIRKG
jgi:hypothetical protein